MIDDVFLGEIRLLGFPYAPKGWLFCQGQLLPITQYPDLFALLGTAFGGDGRNTFALPDLSGRLAVGAGSAPDLSAYNRGDQGGKEYVVLQAGQLPPHTHACAGTIRTGGAADLASPGGAFPATGTVPQYSLHTPTAPLAADAFSGSLAAVGDNQGHPNLQPTLVLNYAIATAGVFPKSD